MEHRPTPTAQWVNLECVCGHHGTVKLPLGLWRLRDWILPRARCTACGRRGAKDMTVANDPATLPSGRYPKL